MMELPEIGVQNSHRTSQFSLAYAAAQPTARVELRIYTSSPVTSSVTYGGVPMTCIDKRDRPAEYRYEIHNPPMGCQVISGTFSDEVLYVVRLFDDAWVQQSSI